MSEIQFERVIYAGQAHAQRLSTGARAGISIGDGTGAGKTSTLAGTILDNWFQNRRKMVWFSVKADLIEAVREDFERLGFKIPIKLINEFAPEQNILMRGGGIVFCTYKSLIAKSKNGDRRVDQIMRWLGTNGLEIFDGGHKAKHAFSGEGGKATQTGQAVLEIQDPVKFPEIRVVYFYEHRQTGAFVAVRATLPHTDPETGMHSQMFSISRPAGCNLFYIKESELAACYKSSRNQRREIGGKKKRVKFRPSSKRRFIF